MNKQDKKKLTKHIELNQHMTEISMFGRTAVVDVVPSDRLIDLIDELVSPVKVPAFVAEKMKRYKSALWMLSSEYFDTSSEADSDELANWIDQNSEKFFRAWLDGYEVEEEPKYRVNIGGLYLKEPLADTNDFTISMTWNKDYAYPFDSWNMAREHTSELGGTVEKV
ncbi:DUF1642 domain-containing protein [Enterococcus avium]